MAARALLTLLLRQKNMKMTRTGRNATIFHRLGDEMYSGVMGCWYSHFSSWWIILWNGSSSSSDRKPQNRQSREAPSKTIDKFFKIFIFKYYN